MNDETQLTHTLLAYLQERLNNPALTYSELPQKLQGGFETQTYRFRLKHAAEELSQPLVLRLYPVFYGSRNAVWESSVQNALHAEGFPVAKAYLVCEDLAILGGAFFIMDFLPGTQLVAAPLNKVPILLGETQAKLHQLNPAPMIRSLGAHGIEAEALHITSRMRSFFHILNEIPSLTALATWLQENQPPVPSTLSICHGDFHPLNILVQGDEVSAVLDWPGLLVGDPVLDVGNTVVLSIVPFKHIAPSLGMDISGLDMEAFARQYLAAYQTVKQLDTTHLAYYRVRRCAQALMEGVHGQKLWQHPGIRQDLIESIHQVTGILVELP